MPFADSEDIIRIIRQVRELPGPEGLPRIRDATLDCVAARFAQIFEEENPKFDVVGFMAKTGSRLA